MPHRINFACNGCDLCPGLCPTQTIFYGEPAFVIDADGCNDCGICAKVCPEDAVESNQNNKAGTEKAAEEHPKAN